MRRICAVVATEGFERMDILSGQNTKSVKRKNCKKIPLKKGTIHKNRIKYKTLFVKVLFKR